MIIPKLKSRKQSLSDFALGSKSITAISSQKVSGVAYFILFSPSNIKNGSKIGDFKPIFSNSFSNIPDFETMSSGSNTLSKFKCVVVSVIVYLHVTADKSIPFSSIPRVLFLIILFSLSII